MICYDLTIYIYIFIKILLMSTKLFLRGFMYLSLDKDNCFHEGNNSDRNSELVI